MEIPKSINDKLQHMEDVYAVLRKNKITFTKTQATKIVGSRAMLERLRASGKIRVIIHNVAYRKGQWDCNAEDVLRHAHDKPAKNRNSS